MVYEIADEVALRRFKSSLYVFPGIVAFGTLPTVIAASCTKSAFQDQLPVICVMVALPVAVFIGVSAVCRMLDRSVIRVHVSSSGLLLGTLAGNKSVARKNILKVQSSRFGAVPVYKVSTREGNFDISGQKDEGGLLIKELRSLRPMPSDEHVYKGSGIVVPYLCSFVPIMMLFFLLTGSLLEALSIKEYSFALVPGFIVWLFLCWHNAFSVCSRVQKKGDRLILSTLLRTIELRPGDKVQLVLRSWRVVVKCDQGSVVVPSTIADFDLCTQDLKKFAGVEAPLVCEACEEQPAIVLGSKIRPERKNPGWW